MKTKLNHLLLLGMAAVVATTVISSCQKIGDDVPSSPFTLTAHEIRCQDTRREFDWTISKDGKTDSVLETIDDMFVTAVNELTVFSTAAVSASSSNEKAVKVVLIDDKSFRLSYVADGEARITVANGSGKSRNETTFTVRAQEYILPAAVLFDYDGKELRVPFMTPEDWSLNVQYINARMPQAQYTITAPKSEQPKPTEAPSVIHHFEYKGVEPENTSFRKLNYSGQDTRVAINTWRNQRTNEEFPAWDDWCNEQGYDISSWLEDETNDFADMKKNLYYARCFAFSTYFLCEMSINVGKNGQRKTGITVYFDNKN